MPDDAVKNYINNRISTVCTATHWMEIPTARQTTKYSNTLNTILLTLIKYLTDLRSDLATRLAEQRSVLESAKTEVEKNITGTPELVAVSEAQQVRLDRQIEQFEELQRVLVKV